MEERRASEGARSVVLESAGRFKGTPVTEIDGRAGTAGSDGVI